MKKSLSAIAVAVVATAVALPAAVAALDRGLGVQIVVCGPCVAKNPCAAR